MSKRYLTKPEFNAILTGLRLLQDKLLAGLPEKFEVILTDCGEDDAIDVDGIDELCAAINFDEVQFTVEGDDDDETDET